VTPQQVAEAVVRKMFENDAASRALGMQVLEVRPGYARVEMRIRPDMLNGHAICHGGLIFSLADSAFAFACNTCNFVTVAASCSIEFLAPVYLNDVLTSEAVERIVKGRTGIYDVSVVNHKEEQVALFRGRCHRSREQVISVSGC